MKQVSTQINDVEKAVLAITSAALFDKEADIPADADWNAIFGVISRHGLSALTFPVANTAVVPEETLNRWSIERDKYIVQSLKNIRCHFDLHKLLTEAGIPYVIIKGPASGSYYPDYMLRGYGDVDFLIEESTFDEVSDYLKSNGFIYEGEHIHHREFCKNDMCYELHQNLPGLPEKENEVLEILKNYFSDIMEEAVPFKQGTDLCMIPNDRHHALILLMHSAYHMENEGVGLRHLCDWAAFASRMSEEFFENEMQGILKKSGLWLFTKLLTALCCKYLGLKEFAFAKIDDEEYLDYMMKDFFSSGNFGINRSRENVAARRNNSYVAINKKGRWGFIRKTFNESAVAAFPIIKKKPLLRPAAWVYVGARHVVRMIKGERSLEFTKALITEDAETRAFVERWHLFEPQQ